MDFLIRLVACAGNKNILHQLSLNPGWLMLLEVFSKNTFFVLFNRRFPFFPHAFSVHFFFEILCFFQKTLPTYYEGLLGSDRLMIYQLICNSTKTLTDLFGKYFGLFKIFSEQKNVIVALVRNRLHGNDTESESQAFARKSKVWNGVFDVSYKFDH